MVSIRSPAPTSRRGIPARRTGTVRVLLHESVRFVSPTDLRRFGAGELPEGILSHEAIVRVGDTSSEAMIQKASFVMELMETRLHGLGADWSRVTEVDIYTIHAWSELCRT